jgi:ABC-type amino acid transport system permease subunit
MEIAAVLFVLTALGGGGIATMRLAGRPRPPTWVALMHGGLAALSIVILGYTAATSGVPMLGQIALGVFVLAALGGATLFLLFPSTWQAAAHPVGHWARPLRAARGGTAPRERVPIAVGECDAKAHCSVHSGAPVTQRRMA